MNIGRGGCGEFGVLEVFLEFTVCYVVPDDIDDLFGTELGFAVFYLLPGFVQCAVSEAVMI
jgi:hypothetical protein